MKLVLWHPWMGDLESALQTEVEEFNQSNAWGLKVELRGFGGAAALADAFLETESKNLPDLLLSSPEGLIELESKTSALLDLRVLVEDREWGLTAEEIIDFLPGVWQSLEEEDQRLGMPILRNARLLIYNRTWAEELGFRDSPSTPVEVRAQVCAAMQANLTANYILRGTGGWLLDNDAYTLLGWLQAFGADYSEGYTFNTSQGLAAFTYLHRLVDEDCTYRLSVARSEPYEAFATRRALIYTGTLVDLPMQAQVSQKLNSTDQWEAIPFPSLQGEGAGIVPLFGQDVALVDGTHEHELGAWLFVRWLLLSRNQTALARSGGMIPVTQSGLRLLNISGLSLPQYRSVLRLANNFHPLHSGSEWAVARMVLEDSAWQLYQPYTKEEDILTILEQLDAMVEELVKK